MASEHTTIVERRASAKWEHLSHLTGIAMGGKQTGWDHLLSTVLDDPTVRIRAVRRLEAIVSLCRLLTRLSEWHFTVLALRFGLTVDDQNVAALARETMAQQLGMSVERVARLEAEGIADLRRRLPQEFPALDASIYRLGGPDLADGDSLSVVP